MRRALVSATTGASTATNSRTASPIEPRCAVAGVTAATIAAASARAVCNWGARDLNATTDHVRDVGRLFTAASRRS